MVVEHRKNAREGRNTTVKFLYQCEAEKLFYFSLSHFNSFCIYHHISDEVRDVAEKACQGVFARMNEVDQHINKTSRRWPVDRLPSMDRSILRLATWELIHAEEPVKVVINEAIELAKIYGTENSGKFINGILDTMAKNIQNPSVKS